MAWPADGWTQMKYIVQLLDEFFKFGSINATNNFKDIFANIRTNYTGDNIKGTDTTIGSLRSTLSGLMSQVGTLEALVAELATRGYSSKATSTSDYLSDIIDGMATAGTTLKSRGYTYATVPPTSGTGSGGLIRSTKDINNSNIEVGYYTGVTTVAECVADKNMSNIAIGEESFALYGSGMSGIDNIDLGAAPPSSLNMTTKAVRSQTSGGILLNPSFTTAAGTDGVDKTFSSWELSSGANFAQSTAIYFQNDPSSSVGYGATFLANASMTQYVRTPTGGSSTRFLDNRLPYFFIVRVYRKDSCDGTVTLRLGTQTETFDISTYADATWHEFKLGVADNKGYYRNFKEDYSNQGVRVGVSLASNTTGTMIVDDIILRQAFLWDGKPVLITSGATDFLLGDTITYTDTPTNTGRMQTTLARLFGVSFPSVAGGTETYSDA